MSDQFRATTTMRNLFLLMLIAFANVALAQKSGSSNVCWRPRPLANCKTWLVTEAGLEMPVASSSAKHLLVGYQNGEGYVSRDFGTRIAFTLGGMVNAGEKTAHGATVSLVNGEQPRRIEYRYRRWLTDHRGIDLSAGVARGTTRGEYDPDNDPMRGLTVSAGISGTYVGADARLDVMRTDRGRTVHGMYVTVRSGSRAAPIVTVTAYALLLALLYAAYRGEYT